MSKKNEFRGDDKKFDQGKLAWDLLPWKSIREVVRVFNFGATRYGEETWKDIKDPRKRYFAAAQRHMIDWWCGEKDDSDSGINHLAHAAWNILVLLWFDLTGWPEEKS